MMKSRARVLQLNKRDLPNILPIDLLTTELRRKNETITEAVASRASASSKP